MILFFQLSFEKVIATLPACTKIRNFDILLQGNSCSFYVTLIYTRVPYISFILFFKQKTSTFKATKIKIQIMGTYYMSMSKKKKYRYVENVTQTVFTCLVYIKRSWQFSKTSINKGHRDTKSLRIRMYHKYGNTFYIKKLKINIFSGKPDDSLGLRKVRFQ